MIKYDEYWTKLMFCIIQQLFKQYLYCICINNILIWRTLNTSGTELSQLGTKYRQDSPINNSPGTSLEGVIIRAVAMCWIFSSVCSFSIITADTEDIVLVSESNKYDRGCCTAAASTIMEHISNLIHCVCKQI